MRPNAECRSCGTRRLIMGALSVLFLLSYANELSAQTGRQAPPPPPPGIFLLIAAVFVIIAGIAALSAASSPGRTHGTLDHNRSAGTASVTVLDPDESRACVQHQWPAAPRGTLATAPDIADMRSDLEAINQADFLTRRVIKGLIVGRVDRNSEVAEAYRRYFFNANLALTARRDLERTKGELDDFKLTQSLRRKELQVRSLELDVELARLELLKLEAERAKERLNAAYNGPVRREDYEL